MNIKHLKPVTQSELEKWVVDFERELKELYYLLNEILTDEQKDIVLTSRECSLLKSCLSKRGK